MRPAGETGLALPLREVERERSRRTWQIRHPAPREVPRRTHGCDHLFNGGRKLLSGRARRALTDKSHKEQYITNCIINTPRVGYFLTGVTVPQAASGFSGVCPHLIHRDIHRICGRLDRARNDGALARRVESLCRLFPQGCSPPHFLPRCPNGGHAGCSPAAPMPQVGAPPGDHLRRSTRAGRRPRRRAATLHGLEIERVAQTHPR